MTEKTLIMIVLIVVVFVSSTMLTVSQSRSTAQIPSKISFKSTGIVIGPINITNNTQLAALTSSGDGSVENPYIIENYDISQCPSYVNGVSIQNTNQHFILKNITILSCFNGFYFNNVSFGSIISSSALNNTEAGFELDFSNNNSLIGNTATTNRIGFYINSSSNENLLMNNTAMYNAYGFFLSTSFNNTIVNNTGQNNAYYDYTEFMSAGNMLNNNMFSNIPSTTLISSSSSMTFVPGPSTSQNWLVIPVIITVIFIFGSGIVILFKIYSTRMNNVQTLKDKVILPENVNKANSSAFCPICGFPILPEDQYCLNCGTKLRN